MAANLSKKFALLCCCLMTMQALRLVISTAGFCVVRFHIDPELFNIFISRLVNAVMMSQLFGNWLGDLFVFALGGKEKLWAAAAANWVQFICFCTALFSICHTECGHLTGFYWSMVCAYFWWKVGEAPTTSIAAPNAADYYFAGFTLSGVWAACLKGLVMRCVTDGEKTVGFHSDVLGDVNVKVVGARSVKITIDYLAAKWLYILTILLAFLMCLAWTLPVAVEGDTEKVADEVVAILNNKRNELGAAIKAVLGDEEGKKVTQVESVAKHNTDEVQITVTASAGQTVSWGNWTQTGPDGKTLVDKLAGELAKKGVADVQTQGMLKSSGTGADNSKKTLTIKVNPAGVLSETTMATAAECLSGVAFGGVLSVPGAMLGAGVGWLFALCFKCCLPTAKYASLTKWCQLIFGIVGALGGMAAGVTPCVYKELSKVQNVEVRGMWVEPLKWPGPVPEGTPKEEVKEKWVIALAALIGLGAGLVLGALVGLIIGAIVDRTSKGDGGRSQLWFAAIESGRHSELLSAGKRKTAMWRGTAAGAFIGSFFGLLTGEITNAGMTASVKTEDGKTDWEKVAIAMCGILIVVLGCGTVYSIYPGMAPCSITQFQYFNIIDICILVLSSSGPLVIMGLDLADDPNKLALSILVGFGTAGKDAKWMWVGFGLVLLIATNICEILVLDIMQHPFSKTAKKVTTSGWRACTLTILMVSFQLVSTGIGFGCVAAGSKFNDGIVNVNSTLVLWTMECCAVMGEGYLTEHKKYEPGKWPTQGMGKWATYKWWNNKAFGNAWAIWCCIGTTNLRRDIMLCRK